MQEETLDSLIQEPNKDGWLFGYWNKSSIQIKFSKNRPVKRDENPHSYGFAVYYLMVEGTLTLKVNEEIKKISAPQGIMIPAGDEQRIIDKSKQCSYYMIKEKSYPNNALYQMVNESR